MTQRSAIWVRLAQPAVCGWCGNHLLAQTVVVSEPATGGIWCVQCIGAVANQPPAEVLPVSNPGTPGGSARREYERRKAADEQRTRDRWGPLGGLAVAVSAEQGSTSAWERGAVGEERLGARLNRLISDRVAVLHDRRIPGTRANIDHLVITPAGVWVIDAKRYKGRPERKAEGGLFGPRTESLLVGRRDRTHLVDGVIRQRQLVQQTVGKVPVTAILCFVEADWPLLTPAFSVRQVLVVSPRRLTRLLGKDQQGDVDTPRVRDDLAVQFPPA